MKEKKPASTNTFPVSGKDFIIKPPGWITRYGISLIGIFLLLVIFLAAIIRYPDKIAAPATITSYLPPIRLTAPQDGTLADLRVTAQQAVREGDILAVFQHNGNTEKILQLDSLTTSWEQGLSALPETLPGLTGLGSLAVPYQRFELAFEQFLHAISKDYAALKTRNLQQQIHALRSINLGLQKQMRWRDKSVYITRNQVTRDSLLFTEGSVSAIDYENSRKRLYGLIESRESQNAQLLENKLKINVLEGQILDISERKSDLLLSKEQELTAALNQLQNEVENWKKDHLLIAPGSGIVQIASAIVSHQYFARGQEVLAMVPTQNINKNKGVALLPFQSSGKVRIGSAIQLKLEGFPFKEYGYLKSEVKQVSELSAKGKGYEVHFDLPDSLVTTFGKHIPLKQEMRGTAEIITKKESILSRIFREFAYLLKGD